MPIHACTLCGSYAHTAPNCSGAGRATRPDIDKAPNFPMPRVPCMYPLSYETERGECGKCGLARTRRFVLGFAHDGQRLCKPCHDKRLEQSPVCAFCGGPCAQSTGSRVYRDGPMLGPYVALCSGCANEVPIEHFWATRGEAALFAGGPEALVPLDECMIIKAIKHADKVFE